ncbi:uncharacterized protein LOC122570907 [Bombus pyrosoma]|uniref:uncharacterized protein LOC122570907 n=1 Tax=Bombus pyrosoma TaxID=396416 RepID=UPI001CB8BE88|nr:uncharacterized protein LOC122570907 [Bombus pyrosoma]
MNNQIVYNPARIARREIRKTLNVDVVTLKRKFVDHSEENELKSEQLRLEHHTKIFASMCPDEILDHYDDYNTRMYYTTLMLGDISGFTDLAEKYTKTGKGGPSKLTETLNSYIGAMVQEILSHNGDVLKFSGDAFIVMWKLHEGMMMRDLAIAAMQTACIIQKHFGSYDTEVGVTLKVKLAIASGKVYFTSIGDPESMSHYIITGTPVWDVKFAEGLCRGGDILVAPSSWQWVNPNEYVHETLPDGIHTLIISCTSMWYQAKDDELITSTDDDDNEYEPDFYDSTIVPRIDHESKMVMMNITGTTYESGKFEQIDYSLRPKVIKAAQACLKGALRSYMLRPVIRSTEMDEPLEYLTEMRHVVILFINVITSNVGKNQLIALVNSAYKLVCKIVDGMHGCVNKTSLFDKDLMFLCVFGLRGDKHELESQIGLRCASKLRSTLIAIENVKSVTVGVTTGMTYCGVVGHILRREYTVIGIPVNKAARLMVAYRDKDSMISLLEEDMLTLKKPHLSIDNEETIIAICNIAQNFTYKDVDPEITMDAMILKLFDSLTPLDQLLLKCASVIGETVNRHMLESLMSITPKREIGLAVTKLFEIRVFGCAIGDFSKNAGPIVFIKNMRNPNSEMDVFCKCIGLTIPDELVDLPRYASCGLMRFKMSTFRDTTYQLLTENQKIELHNQALKYLQHYTRRCVSCGEGQFAKLLGKTSNKEDRKKKMTDIDEMFELDYNDEAINKEDEKKKKELLSCLNLFRRVERKPTVTFSDVDFSSCLCELILMTVYTQILDHCRGIGNIEKTLTALLEFAEICLMNCNIPQARKLLSESETILMKLFESNEDEIVLLPYLTAKIQTLQGQCFLESGSIFEAEGSLEMALKNLGYRFPKLEMMIDLNSLTQLMNLEIKLICPKKTELLNSLEGDNMDYTKQLSECLAQMFELFRFKGMKKHARLAAMWGLSAALESNKDLYILCTSFTNMLITAHMYQDRYIIPYLEQRAINICNESRETLETQELNVIVQLYAGIFFSRWIRGQISKAIQIGFICSRMASAIGSTFLKLVVLPRLIHLLMISCRHSEVVTQLRELEFISHHNFDKSGRTWYYALCADFHLDTGLTILPFQACEQYFLQEGEQMISLHDPEAERRYFTSMWLWCIRTEEWEAAKVWSGRNVESINIMDEHIVAATITALKKLEGLLILYVHKLNSRNADAAITMMEIKSIFKDTKKMSKIVEIVIPRYMLLKAYYWMIKSQKSNAIKILKKLQKVCKKMENKLIYAWALHCEKAWSGGISSVHTDKWREIANSKILNKWDEINVNNSNMIIFTFPLPKYLL